MSPCQQVLDRTMVKTTDAERVCVSPPGLQAAIDKLVVTFSKGRSFVRYINDEVHDSYITSD